MKARSRIFACMWHALWHRMPLPWFVSLVTVFCLLLVPHTPTQASERARWHTFTADNGLAGNIVQSIWEDPQGRLWFGTENGASCYDGRIWKTYRTSNGLLDNNVWSIMGNQTEVWFGTSGGVSVLQPETGTWRSYTTEHGLPDNDVRAVLVSQDGTVWAGTFGNGIGRLSPGAQSWEQVDISSVIKTRDVVVYSIWQSPEGAIWFGTSAFGALRLSADRWELFTFKKASRNTIWGVGVGPTAGSTSFATFRGVVFVSENDSVEVVEKAIQGVPMADTEVLSVARVPTNDLWFGTRSHGAFHFKQGEWQQFTTEDGLARNYIQTILVDHSERVWFGTRGGGVTLLDRQPLSHTALRPILTGRDIQSNTVLPATVARLSHAQNNLQFTFSLSAHWIPPHNVSFRYWLEQKGTAAPLVREIVRSDPAPAINAHSEAFVNLPPGRYELHVIPLIGDHEGVEAGYTFTIDSAPPALSADTIDLIADAQVVERGLTLAQRLFESDREVQLEFAAQDDVNTSDQLTYYYRLESITSTWYLAPGAYARVKLPSGKHTIEVQAIDADGNQSEPVMLTAIVPTPLWQTILVALVLILVPSAISGVIGAVGYQRWARHQALLRAVRGYVIPYDVGPLITVPDRYIGRQHILDTILGKIDNNNFYITGEKRIGKTSLLLQLKQRLLQRNAVQQAILYAPVFRNMQDLAEEQFWLYLIRSIVAEIPGAPQTLLAHTVQPSDYDDFDAESDLEILVRYVQTRKDARHLYIVLLLDEVDTLQRYDSSIRQRFRAFCQHTQRHVRVVLAGVHLPHAEPTETSPWYNIFEPVTLGPLARDDILFLIRNYNNNPYSYTPDAEQAILASGGGKPYMTQWLCSEAVKAMLEAKRSKVTLCDVEQAIRTVESERIA